MGGYPIQGALLNYLKDHTGIILPDEVAAALGESRERVLGGLSNLFRRNGGVPGLTRVSAGVYQYYPRGGKATPKEAQPPEAPAPPPRTTARLLEVVGTTEASGTIVRDEDGKLYRLEAL